MDERRICAFVPARGGSQGVKGKNWRDLGGKPLILWTLEFALSSNAISEVYLSSDSETIAHIGSSGKIGVETFVDLPEDSITELDKNFYFHRRRRDQAQTLSLISEVLFDFVKRNKLWERFDFLLLLQPTSPFRSEEEIDRLLDLLQTDGWSSIVSLKDIGGMHPDRMYKLEDGIATPFSDQSLGDNRPRQSLEKLFIKDGAYYLLRIENLAREIMLGNRILPFFREIGRAHV